jgi:16S rRNA (cytidine1402-2'-O)-methyltransferase
MSTLYVVATPIGNLEDLTFRALRILKEVDFILCEDTRTTKKLLEHYGIKTQTLSYHQHSRLQKIEYIIQLLERGKNLALVSDAGTPGISDPGNKLIILIVENLKNVKIIPIPGASAGITAASISGFPMEKFVFLGFPPAKKRRKKFFLLLYILSF